MKTIGCLSVLLLGVLSAQAEQSEQAVAAASAPSVAAAIEQNEFVTPHKPNTAAKHYMYVYSASWCGPCRAVMPKIVAEYPAMMTDRELEVILVSCDDKPAEALEYLKHYNAPFAAVMFGSSSAHKLPGCAQDIRSIPTIIITDAQGKQIFRGSGRLFANWRQYISKK